MRHFRVLVTVLLALGAASSSVHGQVEELLYPALSRPDDAEFYQTPLGLCEDYPEESTTSEIIRGDMEFLEDTGIDLLRISFGWDGIEGEKDVYDWLFWDEYVSTAVDSFGVTLIPYICYTPLWNSTTDDPDNSWHYPPKDYDEFGEFVFDLVSRYKDKIKTWELWNEPDIWIFWAGDHDGFSKLIKIGSEAVRRADPEAKVVLGGLAHDTEWLEVLLRDYGVSPYVDIVNIHNYFETWADSPMEEIAAYVNEVDRIVLEHGDGQPIWMAEVGYSTFRKGSYVSDHYSAYYRYEHTPEYQAVDLVRRMVKVLSTEKLSSIAWYEIKDLNPGEETIGDFGNNGNLGVAYATHKPKPAQQALKFFNELMAQPTRVIDDAVTVSAPDGSDVHVHAFERENGDVIVFGWLQTYVPDKRGEVGEGDHLDERHVKATVTVPGAFAGGATAYNELGDGQPDSSLKTGEDTSTVVLDLRGGGLQIIEIVKGP
jgi:hypothetical protein